MPTRPLLPGRRQSRVEFVRQWLLRSVPGRLLLAGLAVKLICTTVGFVFPSAWTVLDVVDALGSLAIIVVVAYVLTRGAVWAKRRLLWRVRRKLILSYVFVGLVPGLLIASFFIVAGLLLFFNFSTYLLQSRVRTLQDQARFLAEAVVLEAEHGDPAAVLRRSIEQRQALAAERYPFTSIAIVPVSGLQCGTPETGRGHAPPPPMTVGPWQHLPPPERLPRWIRCDGFTGLMPYKVGEAQRTDTRLVARAVAVPRGATPAWAAVIDLPLTVAIEQRLRDETGIHIGEVSTPNFDDRQVTWPLGRALEPRPQPPPDEAARLFGEWVAVLDVVHWDTGATNIAAASIRLNPREIYAKLTGMSSRVGQLILLGLAIIAVLFLIIQFVALVIGFGLARQITGAVHDLFVGTEHLRNRDFTHHIPVRARDQLGELAESFNVMTDEVTKLLRENAEKARMEQEMLAAREIQQKLLPSGPLHVPGLSVTAFCEPAREVAGDYYDFLPISDMQLGVLIADVSGKGLPAGLYMAQLKVLAQSLARVHTSPAEFLKATNRVVTMNIDSKSFITMSYGVIDFAKREMRFARAGHCPLIRIPGRAPAGLRTAEVIAPDGLVLGLKIDDGQMFDAMIQEVTIPLLTDDLIVFFTDGVSETMNEAFDCYGEGRLTKVLEQYSHLPFDQLRAFIFADLRAFSGEADQHDDMTMILMKVEPVPVPAPRPEPVPVA
jgi:sigma-B regulation protein RsbU (phosphoserine phosphatase)